MSWSLAWVTPFSAASDISAFSDNLLTEFLRISEELEISVSVFINENGPRLWTELPTIALTGTPADREILLGFDAIVFNIGNNLPNHEYINRLALEIPGVVIAHDLVMHHALAGMLRIGEQKASRRDLYALAMGAYYGTSGFEGLRHSDVCVRGAEPMYAPWDTSQVPSFPLIEPFVATAAAIVVHSRYAEAAVERFVNVPVLRLALPWDQKPSLSEEDLRGWAAHTETKVTCEIVCFGHISVNKCLDQVILAFAQSTLLRSRAHLTIAGHPNDHEHLSTLRGLVAQFHLGSCVTFELSVSGTRLQQIKRDADLFVNLRHPNTESASGSLVEQLNSGKPVMLYPEGAYGEIDASAAIHVQRSDGIDALVMAIELIAVDPRARVRIGSAGRAFVRCIGRKEYVQRLCHFLHQNRSLLRARKACAVGRRTLRPSGGQLPGAQWLSGLNRARRLFAGFQESANGLDVLPFAEWDDETLAGYVALGVFGQRTGSAFEKMLKAQLLTLSRGNLYESLSEALFIWRLAEDPALFKDKTAHGVEKPMLLPTAWLLLSALGWWTLVRCCYAGFLGRPPEPSCVAYHATNPSSATLSGLLEAFIGCPEFLLRRAPAECVSALRRHFEAAEAPARSFRPISLHENLHFTSDAPHCVDYLGQGWHEPECNGTWTSTEEAVLLFSLDPGERRSHLRLTGRLFLKEGECRVLKVRVNGRPAIDRTVAGPDLFELCMQIEPNCQFPAAHAIEIDCGKTVSPKDLGKDDIRQIGFCLRSLHLSNVPDGSRVADEPGEMQSAGLRMAESPLQEELAAQAMHLFDGHVAMLTAARKGGDFNAEYYQKHRARFARTVALIPPANGNARVLEIGATAFLQVALHTVYGYQEVAATEHSTVMEHKFYRKSIEVAGLSVQNLTVSLDLENDIFPFPDANFDLVLCCEVIEHLDVDPMFMLAEINRISKPQAMLVLTTPNCCSGRNLWKIAQGIRPHFFMQYDRNRSPYRHNFEYDSNALAILFKAAGFTIEQLETHDVFEPTLAEAQAFIRQNSLPNALRGDDLFVVGRCTGRVNDRWPEGMYV